MATMGPTANNNREEDVFGVGGVDFDGIGELRHVIKDIIFLMMTIIPQDLNLWMGEVARFQSINHCTIFGPVVPEETVKDWTLAIVMGRKVLGNGFQTQI